MSIRYEDLEGVRRGHRGLAVVLYLDVPENSRDDAWDDIADVMAIDAEASAGILAKVAQALADGHGLELHDRAAESLSLLLASSPEVQGLLASMLEGVAGRSEHAAPITHVSLV